MHLEALNIHQIIVFLVAAGVVVPLVGRVRISPVLAFLVVGLIIGPHGVARFADQWPFLNYIAITDLEGVRALAELGVVFLLFTIGLELSLERLWAMRRLVFGLGGAQVLVTGAVIAMIASFFDNPLPTAVILGAGFALSSTAIVVQLLSENRRLGTRAGRATFAVLLCQDLAVVPILFLVAAFARPAGGSVIVAFGAAIGQAVIAVAIILVLGRWVIRPLFRYIGRAASREMFLALVLLVIIGTALVTEQAGLSMALGAFLAGLLFAETEYRHAIEVDIEPFKGLLLGLFFVSVGMSIDIAQIGANPLWLAVSVVGLFAIKSPIAFGLARLFGEPRSSALEAGLLLGQGGEFAFVIVGSAAALGLLTGDTAQFMLIVAGLTMFVTPLVANAARRTAGRLEAREAQGGEARANIADTLTGHVIIVGFGRVGQMLGSLLDDQELPYIAIDRDAGLVAGFSPSGACVYFGDASQPDLLRKFNIDEASAVVATMDSPSAAEHVVDAVRQHWPSLPIYARARDAQHAVQLIEHGASHAVPETTEASLQLSEIVLIGAGVPDDAARQMIDTRRQEEQATVDEGRH